MIKTVKENLHKEVYQYIHHENEKNRSSTLCAPKLPQAFSNLEYNYNRTAKERWLLPF